MKILFVDENTCLANSMAALIRNWGYEVESYHSGKDALRMFSSTVFDLVLTEVLLADMKGEEIISGLKKISPDIWIVTMTGNNSRDLEVRIRKLGIIYYMVKPLEKENLRSLLEHLSRRMKASGQHRSSLFQALPF